MTQVTARIRASHRVQNRYRKLVMMKAATHRLTMTATAMVVGDTAEKEHADIMYEKNIIIFSPSPTTSLYHSFINSKKMLNLQIGRAHV